MQEFYHPKFEDSKFHCPYCQVYAHQVWTKVFISSDLFPAVLEDWNLARCAHCGEPSFWRDGKMVFPSFAIAEKMHPDMPEECQRDYIEASLVYPHSSRAAAALLRLLVQKMMPLLGEAGKNLNDDIKSLVRKGLPKAVQKALDCCRVIGNNAVHPGEIELCDTPEDTLSLFSMINFIVEHQITSKKKISELYDKLPAGAKDAIGKRDNGR